MKKEYLKDDPKTRGTLKFLGFLLTGIGGMLFLIGVVSIFSSFGSFGPPRNIWMPFVGIILLGPGITCLKFAYMGKVARYTSSQISPVVKDTVNYMIDGTKDEIIDVVEKVRGSKTESQSFKRCPSCNEKNDIDAKFCDNCGRALSKRCNQCNSDNDDDASFCKNCGNKI